MVYFFTNLRNYLVFFVCMAIIVLASTVAHAASTPSSTTSTPSPAGSQPSTTTPNIPYVVNEARALADTFTGQAQQALDGVTNQLTSQLGSQLSSLTSSFTPGLPSFGDLAGNLGFSIPGFSIPGFDFANPLQLLTNPFSSFMGVDTIECTGFFCSKCTACCSIPSVFATTADQFNTYRQSFIMNSFYTGTVRRSLQLATDDIRNALSFKTVATGTFIDASIFSDTQLDLQVQTVNTMQNYTVSDQVCRFGTIARSLAASDAKVDATKLVLSEAGLARNLGTRGSVATAGRGQDNQARLFTFVQRYCDLKENNEGLGQLCQTATPVADMYQSRDISFGRVLDDRLTLSGDFTDANITPDESNVVSLANYLYGHRQPTKRVSLTELRETPGRTEIYLEFRSAFARRAAAQNSFNTLAAMKAAGSGASDAYLSAVLQSLGLPDEEIPKYLGGEYPSSSPASASYYAQMELLTKKVYQDPAFYANLMESRPNVGRMSAAMQGVNLMQGRDIYRSIGRSEMLLALLVELEARKATLNNQGPKSDK